jgi:hypothetical protein
MDRLPALIALGLLFACDEPAAGSSASAEPRVNAVMASGKTIKLGELCDVAPEPAKAFSWPELTTGAPPRGDQKYRWVNVWATWCQPCVEELPLLARSFAQWKEQKHAVALTLLSVDNDADAAKSFIAARKELPSSLQFKDASSASTWLTSVGLSSGSAIPVHLVLDAQDQLLCARSGGISASDLDRFQRALFP